MVIDSGKLLIGAILHCERRSRQVFVDARQLPSSHDGFHGAVRERRRLRHGGDIHNMTAVAIAVAAIAQRVVRIGGGLFRLGVKSLIETDAMRPGVVRAHADATAQSLLNRSQHAVVELRSERVPGIHIADQLTGGVHDPILQGKNTAGLQVRGGAAGDRRRQAAGGDSRPH